VLNRRCTGFELNPEFVELIRNRLTKKFRGFNSFDERIKRIPKDLPSNYSNKIKIEETLFK
jgi:DNA modification methylase